MSQYTTGTVTVANGSNIVTGLGTSWLTEVAVGNTFKKLSENSVYSVSAVDSNTQIQLSTNYAGSGESGVSYQITKDFTPNYNLAEINAGDKDWPYHLTEETIRPIDSALADLATAIGISGHTLVTNAVVFVNSAGQFSGEFEFTYNSTTNVMKVPTIHLTSGFSGEMFDTDGTLSANSDSRIATQKAVKTYVDAYLPSVDALTYKGAVDCSSNPNYPAANAGDYYKVSVAGKIGGASGADVDANDALICNVDGSAAGTQAAVGANWDILQANVDDATTTTSGVVELATNAEALTGEDTIRAITSDDLKYVIETKSIVSGEVIPISYIDTDGGLSANSDTKIASQKATKTYVDGRTPAASISVSGIIEIATNTEALTGEDTVRAITSDDLKFVLNSKGVVSGEVVPYSYLDTDGDLTANSDTKVATQKAVKTYVDGNVVGNIATSSFLGRVSAGSGEAENLTPAQARTILNVENGADVTDATNVDAAGAVMESDYDANTILVATSDNTPVPLTVNTSTFVGRKATGNISAMSASETRTILNVEDGANNYVLPTASAGTLGGVKVGTRLTITDGVLSAVDQTSGVPDGDKVDIFVSGEIWTINPSVVTFSKIQNVATDSFLGRTAAGSGEVENLTAVQARTILNVEDGANNYVLPTASAGTLGGVKVGANLVINEGILSTIASGEATLESNVFTGQQTFSETKDTTYTITDGAAFEIDPVNGNIQVITLGASRTPAATNFEAGQAILLGVDDGSSYTLTWTTVNPTWVKAGGTASAPTLAATGYTWILLWKVSTTIYACEVGQP